MMNSIKNIELPKDDARCASILRTVIRNLKEKEKVNSQGLLPPQVKDMQIRFML